MYTITFFDPRRTCLKLSKKLGAKCLKMGFLKIELDPPPQPRPPPGGSTVPTYVGGVLIVLTVITVMSDNSEVLE